MAKTALITGITGQDGSYLAEFLLARGYRVAGMTRRSSTVTIERIAHLVDEVEIVQGDLLDQNSLAQALKDVRPDEVYNLAAQCFVPTSVGQPIFTSEVTGLGVTRLLDAILQVDKNIKFYQASSSEMFGKVSETPQTRTTPFHPRSPYGVAKVYGHYITLNYRESYGLFACSAAFCSITNLRAAAWSSSLARSPTAVARIKHGLADRVASGQPGRQARLGPRARLCPRHVADAAAGRARDFVIATGAPALRARLLPSRL